jgi:hypothetical protein
MADGTARVVNAGAQSAQEPPCVLLPALAHTRTDSPALIGTTIEDHEMIPGQLLR